MNTQHLRRTFLSTVAAVALAGLVTGCGSAGSTQGDAPAKSSSPSTSTSAGGKLTKADFADKIAQAIATKKTAHVSMVVGSAMTAAGDVSYSSAAPSMQMTISTGGQRLEMRLVDGAFYVQVPGVTPPGKFLKATKNTPGMGPMIGQLQSFGPSQSVAAMRAGLKDLKDVGPETVGGTAVEHYKVIVDTKVLVSKMGMPATTAGQLPPEVTYDMYVDRDNLLRRAVVDVSGQKITMDATHWGKPVHVAAPPASQVVTRPAG